MNRRTFAVLAAGGIASWPGWRRASAQARVHRVGFLASSPPPPFFLDNFRAGLREQGLAEGRNVDIVLRATAGTPEGIDALANELVRLPVDLVLAWATPAALAARRATSTVPVVFVGVADPVGAGIVASLARPGGNVTGVTNIARDLNAKLVEFLIQVAPDVRHIAVLRNPTNASTRALADETVAAGRAFGREVAVFEAGEPRAIDAAFAAMAHVGSRAVVVLPDPMYLSERRRIAELALRYGLPSAYARREAAEAGGLLAYGASLAEQTRLATVYVARILRGARPADMPIEQPTRLELVVNLATAKALGLTIPQALLLRADEVIQ